MPVRIALAGALALGFILHAYAQAPSDGLTDQQRTGRMLMVQNCGICHLKATREAQTYGPVLHRGSLSGSDEAMRAIIAAGTERMPAFRHHLKPAEVDAIVAWVRTVPAPPAAPSTTAANDAKGGR